MLTSSRPYSTDSQVPPPTYTSHNRSRSVNIQGNLLSNAVTPAMTTSRDRDRSGSPSPTSSSGSLVSAPSRPASPEPTSLPPSNENGVTWNQQNPSGSVSDYTLSATPSSDLTPRRGTRISLQVTARTPPTSPGTVPHKYNPNYPNPSSRSVDIQYSQPPSSTDDSESTTAFSPSNTNLSSTATNTTVQSNTTPKPSSNPPKANTRSSGDVQPHPLRNVTISPTPNLTSSSNPPGRPQSRSGHENRMAPRPRSHTHLSPLPPGIKLNPINYASIFRKSAPSKRMFPSFSPFSRSSSNTSSIKGIFTVNPFLYIPPELLPELGPDEDERDRKNLRLEAEGGGIDVDVWLIGQLPSSLAPVSAVPVPANTSSLPPGHGPPTSHVRILPTPPPEMDSSGVGQIVEENTYHLQHQQTVIPQPQPPPPPPSWNIMNMKTSLYLGISGELNNTSPLIARIHTPTPNRPPFHLTLNAGDGPVFLHLPRSFHGMITTTIASGDPNNHIILSRDMENSAVILSESSKARTYFVGDMRKLSHTQGGLGLGFGGFGSGPVGHHNSGASGNGCTKSPSHHGHGDRQGGHTKKGSVGYGSSTYKEKGQGGLCIEIDRVEIAVADAKVALQWEGEKDLSDVKWRKIRKG